ncbi:MAG: NAD(P)H-hydrate dehydratase [Chloroflexi bacterium]|nr:NAD(P)H-hydrate dehydratase [Chloroflexota bacterium]
MSNAMKFVSVAEMIAIEKAANSKGFSYEMMMENAGANLARIVNSSFSHMETKRVLGLVGKGNNGGDTLIGLSRMAEQGWEVCAYVVGKRNNSDEIVKSFVKSGGKIIIEVEDKGHSRLKALIKEYPLILDGLLGTGISLPLRAPITKVLRDTKDTVEKMDIRPMVIAVDCPSGVNCDNGEVADDCLYANLTVCMAAVKIGMLRLPAFAYLGKLRLASIGLPAGLKSWKSIKRIVADATLIKEQLPARPLDAHKGTFGTAMVVAGSLNYTGAALLAGKAAYRIGAGLVNLAVPSPLHAALSGHLPEATWLILPDQEGVIAENAAKLLLNNLNNVTALLLGPGFGLEETTKKFIEYFLSSKTKKISSSFGLIEAENNDNKMEMSDLPPMVVDADGLKLLAQIEGWETLLPSTSILTPHPGEMAILTGMAKDEIQENRLKIVEQVARKWGHVVVLKGAFTLIASPDGYTCIIPVATPALARAGTGDVLAGMITGLLAQGLDPYPAAYTGAWLHAQAGLNVEIRMGGATSILAGDLLEEIPNVLR